MKAVLGEVSGVVVEIDASFGMTKFFLASEKDYASDRHILREDKPVVKIQLGSTGASHDGVVVLVAVVARVQEVLHVELRERDGHQE